MSTTVNLSLSVMIAFFLPMLTYLPLAVPILKVRASACERSGNSVSSGYIDLSLSPLAGGEGRIDSHALSHVLLEGSESATELF